MSSKFTITNRRPFYLRSMHILSIFQPLRPNLTALLSLCHVAVPTHSIHALYLCLYLLPQRPWLHLCLFLFLFLFLLALHLWGAQLRGPQQAKEVRHPKSS